MGLFETVFRSGTQKQEPVPKRVEIPQAIHEREEMLAGYLAALERLEAQEQGVRLEDYDIQLQPEDQRKIEELQRDEELRAAVSAYRDRQEKQRKVA